MTNEVRPLRRRGKGFPALALDESVAAIRKIGQYGRRHTLSGFAGYLGHRTTNSGPFQSKMAALNDWGLIDRQGDEISLTDLAQQIAYPTSPDREAQMLRQAFFNAALFATVYEESAKGVELSLDLLGNRAVNALGVAPQRRDEFARSFAQSAVAAGLARTGPNASVVLLADDQKDEDEATSQPPVSRESGPAAANETSSSALPPGRSQGLPTLHQEWAVKGGTVVLEAWLDQALPAAAFGELASIAAAIEKLVAVLGEEKQSAATMRREAGSTGHQ